MTKQTSSPNNNKPNDQIKTIAPDELKALADFFGNNSVQHLQTLKDSIEKNEERIKNIRAYLGFANL